MDYGGTLDTNGTHWAEVLWEKYKGLHLPLCKEKFREAYVYTEKTMAEGQFIHPGDNFYDVLLTKANIQIDYLLAKGYLKGTADIRRFPEIIAGNCYNHARTITRMSKSVLETLSKKYRMVIVSNFYGNIRTVLEDFGLIGYPEDIIESASIGIRKPDPGIFLRAVRTLGCKPEETAVVGDSFSNDILPGKRIGCRTIWLKGKGWNENGDMSLPDITIQGIRQLPAAMEKLNSDLMTKP